MLKVRNGRRTKRRRKILDKEYEKIGNKKRDEKNKFVTKIGKENDVIAVQDENIAEGKSSKMKGWGKRIQHSIMGGIMRDRGKLSQTVIVERRFAATQNCPECGSKNKLMLEERRYTCG
ncbi:MAG: hypothetical protein LBO67_02390 [Spirochaetaceae bacterium]|jgi:transposase|nr:hypothetical protein [Spirochaetaceae bacterium]